MVDFQLKYRLYVRRHVLYPSLLASLSHDRKTSDGPATAMLLRLGALTPLLRSSLFSPKSFILSPLRISKPFFSTVPFQSLASHSSNPKPTTLFDNNNNNAISVDPYYLSCCVPDKDKPLRISVLLSGGVYSSVALRLLHAAGHHCTAFYLKIWFQEDFDNFWSECPWEDDLKFAKGVCDQVDVPLEVVHLTDEYWNNVVSFIIEEYQCGRTPNPDVLCDTRIKFGAFMDAINNMEFDYVASGHYAHVIHPVSDQINKPSVLELSKDTEEARNLALKFDLPNKDRKDSQGICFLGKIKFSEFVARHIGEMEGVMLEAETGDFLGTHRGFWFYTIGQRQGLHLPGGPWYVLEKDVKNNVVFVSRNYFLLDKRRRSFCVHSLRWLSGSPPDETNQLQCKVRHGPAFYDCSVKI